MYGLGNILGHVGEGGYRIRSIGVCSQKRKHIDLVWSVSFLPSLNRSSGSLNFWFGRDHQEDSRCLISHLHPERSKVLCI